MEDGNYSGLDADSRRRGARLKYLDGAARHLLQPVSHTYRTTTAAELGTWPLRDLQLALGYNFNPDDQIGRSFLNDSGPPRLLLCILQQTLQSLGSVRYAQDRARVFYEYALAEPAIGALRSR